MVVGDMCTEEEYVNYTSKEWVLTVTDKVQSMHPEVPERVCATLERLLNGQLIDGKLTSKNLRLIAAQLLTEQAHQKTESDAT